MKEVKIKLAEGATMPTKGTSQSSGYDLYALEDTEIPWAGRCIIPTGVYLEMPAGLEVQIRPRSGNSVKGMVGLGMNDSETTDRYNCDVILGTIDADYRGQVGVIVRNFDATFTIAKGTRIAQMVFAEVPEIELVKSDKLTETSRGEGGFGHTGTK